MDRAQLKTNLATPATVRWEVATGPIDYPLALARMESEVATIADGHAQDLVWLLEHPPLYTAGTSAKPQDLVAPYRFPVFQTGRGGQYTYHGPGQRVAYVMLDLRKRGNDVRGFVAALEGWIISSLASFGISGKRREDRVGVWVERPIDENMGREDKIASIGIRVRRGVTFHGISINLDPDLEHFTGIVPCGVTAHGITSFRDLKLTTTLAELDEALLVHFNRIFKSN